VFQAFQQSLGDGGLDDGSALGNSLDGIDQVSQRYVF